MTAWDLPAPLCAAHSEGLCPSQSIGIKRGCASPWSLEGLSINPGATKGNCTNPGKPRAAKGNCTNPEGCGQLTARGLCRSTGPGSVSARWTLPTAAPSRAHQGMWQAVPCCSSAICCSLRRRWACRWKRVLREGSPTSHMPLG